MTELPHRTLGRYVLLRHLAQGGMGEVYLAEQPGPHGVSRRCVLKIIRPELPEAQAALPRFIEEARVLASLNHRNIVQIYEFGEDDGAHFIAMEHVEGLALSDLLAAAGALPVELALYIAREMLSGLAHAHGSSRAGGSKVEILHRDVTPSNVLISRAGDVKLVDFGLARRNTRQPLTSFGLVLGKRGYLAPELLDFSPATQQSDLYAVGVCLYEMLSGKSYVDHRNVARYEPPPVPGFVDAICRRAMATSPRDRFASAEAMRKKVQEALARVAPATDADALAAFVRRHASEALTSRSHSIALPASEPSAPAPAPSGSASVETGRPRSPWLALVILALLAVALGVVLLSVS